MSDHSGTRLSRAAALGIRELPSNTVWLLGKVFNPVVNGTVKATTTLTDRVSTDTQRSVRRAQVQVEDPEAKKRGRDAKRPNAHSGRASSSSAMTGSAAIADSDQLTALTKKALVALAQKLDVEELGTRNKGELVSALASKGVPIDLLTKRDLRRLAESRGLDVRASISKPELIASIT